MVKAALTRETQSTTGVITGMKSNYILHLGAGIGSELSGYLQRDVQGVFLYEPAAPSYQELEKKAQQYKQVHVVQKAVTLAESQVNFTSLAQRNLVVCWIPVALPSSLKT